MGITFSDPDVDTDENTVQLAGLTPADNAVIIGNGTAWVAESGATLKTSLGLTIGVDVQAYAANLTSWAAVTPVSYLTTSAAAAAYQPLTANGTSWAAVTRASGFDTFAATPSSANLRSLVTDEAGSGSLYFTGGALGTPASGTLSSCTGLPVSTGISGLGTGIATALAVNAGSAGAPVLFNGALGTPSSGTLTNATGLPASSIVTTATNDSAASGKIGEYIEATLVAGSAISLTTGSAKTVTSISLTAGDWDVEVKLYFLLGASTTITAMLACASQTTDTLNTSVGNLAVQMFPSGTILSNASEPQLHTGSIRFSLATTTTIYAVGRSTFGASTASVYGTIRARRVR